jgi:hypothetical protein
MNIFEPSSLALIISICVIALSVLMSFSAVSFRLRQARLPDATAFEDIRERRVSEEKRLSDLRDEARIIEQQIKEKDRLTAEVASLQQLIELLKMELANLEPARTEIEEVKQKAAETAGELARILQEKKEAEDKLALIQSEIDKGQKQIEYLENILPEKIAKLEDTLSQLKIERSAIEAELPQLRIERDNAMHRIEEARILEARIAALEVELKNLEDRVNAKRELEEAIEQLRPEATHLRNRKQELLNEVSHIEARLAFLNGELNGQGREPKGPRLPLEDIVQLPRCLEKPAVARRAQRTENEMLADVSTYLKKCGLEYDFRTIQAFHTCLKVNDHAQITVLAGVSGTGKSLLPRRYSEAMGIHFHQIAVEPRWDSPQDLLGFYNYIEQRYRATDLTRLLAHMDPYRTIPIEGDKHDRRDHMALVLLDEMNLARVEYYFSEFLSRLEVRPRLSDVGDELRRRSSLIPIDIRGSEKGFNLFPSHNVLFAGTMNDDESTQSLSDKVLDRGNIIQFSAPKYFAAVAAKQNPEIPNEALLFSTWSRWLQSFDRLGTDQERIDKSISKLASIMERFGRPFGHRLRDAILSYIANYPFSANHSRNIHVPLADQIELRILPKLRGLEIDGHASTFADLSTLVRNDLGDSKLADYVDATIAQQGRGNGLFSWRGLSRAIG